MSRQETRQVTDFYDNRRVLVLGGLGFIGSNLTLKLVDCGAHVTVVDSLAPGLGANWFNVQPVRNRIRVVVSDLRDADRLTALVRSQDVIFSLAGRVSHIASMRDPLIDQDINCRSQLSLLESCRQHNPAARIVFASTRQLYGRPRYLPVDERHPIAPVDVNGVSKRAAEMFFTLYHKVHGLHTVSLRLTNTYGPRMNLCGFGQGFMNVFLNRALTNSRIDIFGTGLQRRDFNYVDDVVDAFLLAGQDDRLDGRIFNLGHADHASLLEVVRLLQRHADVDFRCVPFPADYAAIDVGDYYGDFSRFHEATGWQPKCDLAQGIAATWRFFDQHREWYLESEHDSGVRSVQRIPAASTRD
ncbi:MAG: GDP-mannose 4,6-dehydratase [Planctomycetia bacterium]|nr:GDP-mannose 4,6-dehydratase [Planctomycetia bacterium]